MDGNRIDNLSRTLATGLTRRAALKAVTSGLLGALGVRAAKQAGAQVTQVQCGNQSCASNPGGCNPGCVCCVYSNTNSRCRPPGTCSPGTTVCPPGQKFCSALGRCAACCAAADCDDGNPCTQNVCTDGVCSLPAVVCPPAVTPCHVAVCRPGAGGCVEEPVTDGTPCNDGNACTQTDTCLAGACVGTNPVVCPPASNQCHDVGTCDPATGLCSDPIKPDGTTCDDEDACTQTDTCQGGVCLGSDPVACTASDDCHDIGTCDSATGLCSDPTKADGTPCSDSNACTDTDTCQSGICTPGTDVLCPPAGPCQFPGVCNPSTGACDYVTKGDGNPCDDGVGCTENTTCFAGVCGGGTPVVCTGACEVCTEGACRSTCGVGEACHEIQFGSTTFGICCPTGRDGCLGTGGLVCCGAGEICHESTIGGLTIGACCPAGQGCAGSNALPVCCGTGETCHETTLGGNTFGTCCPAGQQGCATSIGSGSFSPVCCGIGETCHETTLGTFTIGVCCAAGRACAGIGGLHVCCNAGESCVAIPGLPAGGEFSHCCPDGLAACATDTNGTAGICCAAGETCVGEYPNLRCSPA